MKKGGPSSDRTPGSNSHRLGCRRRSPLPLQVRPRAAKGAKGRAGDRAAECAGDRHDDRGGFWRAGCVAPRTVPQGRHRRGWTRWNRSMVHLGGPMLGLRGGFLRRVRTSVQATHPGTPRLQVRWILDVLGIFSAGNRDFKASVCQTRPVPSPKSGRPLIRYRKRRVEVRRDSIALGSSRPPVVLPWFPRVQPLSW